MVTPWFPSADTPYAGIFVREWVRSLGIDRERVCIVHVASVPLDRTERVTREELPFGSLLRVEIPADPMTPRSDMARLHLDALRRHAMDVIGAAGVIHAHVGMPSGWAAAQTVRDDQRLIVVEHATYLGALLSSEDTNRDYGEMLRRADALLVVGEDVARAIRFAHPTERDVVSVVGNPVDATIFRHTDRDRSRLNRWLFVGNFVARKGVHVLLREFAIFAAGRPDATLTLVGRGELEGDLRKAARDLGVADRVEFVGPLQHADLQEAFSSHDVLVHLATHETFGLTVVEAAMAGLPVVVSRCGGPEETLREAAVRGQVAFVDDRRRAAVTAVLDLEARVAGADTERVSAELAARFGSRAFGERLLALSDGDRGEAGSSVATASARVAVVIGARDDAALVARFLVADLARNGWTVLEFVPDSTEPPRSARGVTVVDITARLHPTALSRVVRRAFVKGPTVPLTAARRAVLALPSAMAARPAAATVDRRLGQAAMSWKRAARALERRVDDLTPASAARIESVDAELERSLSRIRGGVAEVRVISLDPGGRRLADAIVARHGWTGPESARDVII